MCYQLAILFGTFYPLFEKSLSEEETQTVPYYRIKKFQIVASGRKYKRYHNFGPNTIRDFSIYFNLEPFLRSALALINT